jgi:hypothetical protein
MTGRRLTKLEIQIMETLWDRGEASIREMQEAFPEKKRPGYTTIQKTVYRMEEKKVVRRPGRSATFISLSPQFLEMRRSGGLLMTYLPCSEGSQGLLWRI